MSYTKSSSTTMARTICLMVSERRYGAAEVWERIWENRGPSELLAYMSIPSQASFFCQRQSLIGYPFLGAVVEIAVNSLVGNDGRGSFYQRRRVRPKISARVTSRAYKRSQLGAFRHFLGSSSVFYLFPVATCDRQSLRCSTPEPWVPR